MGSQPPPGDGGWDQAHTEAAVLQFAALLQAALPALLIVAGLAGGGPIAHPSAPAPAPLPAPPGLSGWLTGRAAGGIGQAPSPPREAPEAEAEAGPPKRRRKPSAPRRTWSEEEHRGFLLGLQRLGKGDWRGISRSFVPSRSPTQVASHAQKYYLRQAATGATPGGPAAHGGRASIHDIGLEAVAEAEAPAPAEAGGERAPRTWALRRPGAEAEAEGAALRRTGSAAGREGLLRAVEGALERTARRGDGVAAEPAAAAPGGAGGAFY